MPPKKKWKTIEEYRDHKNELARTRRDQKIASGFCANSGCRNPTKNHYCKECATIKAQKNRERRVIHAEKLEDIEKIDIMISNVPGTNRLDRIQRLVSLYHKEMPPGDSEIF